MRAIYPLISLLVVLIRTDAQGGNGIPLSDDFWLLGDFTQNRPCKADRSDPPEVRVKIATDHIDSKAGVCKFLNAELAGKRVNATMECQFPAGPLIGEVAFTQRTNKIIDFVDRDNQYAATLYRCPR
jgi:hypothetical protein